MPLSLGGIAVLPLASCERCRKITARLEEIFARETMVRRLRSQLNIPTRRPKERPTSGKIGVLVGERREQSELLIEHIPIAYFSLKLPPPGILIGREASDQLPYLGMAFCMDSDTATRPLAKNYTSYGLRQRIDPFAFCRMLAKIAHGVAFIARRPETFVPFLPPIIRGESLHVGHYVGGADALSIPPGSSQQMHEIRIISNDGPNRNYLTVEIQLFAPLGGLIYQVVVGVI